MAKPTPELTRRRFIGNAAGGVAAAGLVSAVGFNSPVSTPTPAAAGEQFFPKARYRNEILRRVTYGIGPNLPVINTNSQFREYLHEQLFEWQKLVANSKLGDGLMEEKLANNLGPVIDGQRVLVLKESDAELARKLWDKAWWSEIATTYATIIRRAKSDAQLYEMMTELFNDHFNLYGKANFRFTQIGCVAHDRAIRKHALGKFGDLLVSASKSGSLLLYLTNTQNKAGAINENYARELLELHCVGDNNFTEDDVKATAKLFTGWSINWAPPAWHGFQFRNHIHDPSPVEILGWKSSSHTTQADCESFLHHLAMLPDTANNVCTKIARRFLGDQPAPKVINEMVDVWARTGGDIAKVTEHLLLSPQFYYSIREGKRNNTTKWDTNPANPGAGLLKRPADHLVSCMRALNSNPWITSIAWQPYHHLMGPTGHTQFQWPAPNGFPDASGAWLSPALLYQRMETAASVCWDGIRYTHDGKDQSVENFMAKWSPRDVIDRATAQFGAKADAATSIATVLLAQEPHPFLAKQLQKSAYNDETELPMTLEEIAQDGNRWITRQIAASCFSCPQFQLR